MPRMSRYSQCWYSLTNIQKDNLRIARPVGFETQGHTWTLTTLSNCHVISDNFIESIKQTTAWCWYKFDNRKIASDLDIQRWRH